MLIFGSLKVHIVNLKFAQKYLIRFGCNNHYSDTATEDDTTVRFWRLNVANTYLKIRIHIFGYGKLKRTLRAFICSWMTSVGVGKPHWRLTEERSMMRVVD
jgi:hypothetical protein